MPSWTLEDAREIALEAPYTFYKPSQEFIARVAVGETVKLIFRFESDDAHAPRAERMWVLVEEILGDGRFTGRLDNDPVHITDLACGDPVQFEACHIINTEHTDPDDIVEKYLGRCFVTQRILGDGEPVGYLYREPPDHDDDSGWRLTVGDETEAYMDVTDNIAYVSLGAVLNVDDSFIGLLDAPPGSAFARSAPDGEFVALDEDDEEEDAGRS